MLCFYEILLRLNNIYAPDQNVSNENDKMIKLFEFLLFAWLNKSFFDIDGYA